jgi:membrane-associated HD superfamily phosphohydrolase
VTEKRNDLILGYRAITLREGDTEGPRAASLLRDRPEALTWIADQARTAFAGDPRGVQLASEAAAAFVQPNVVLDRAETEWRRVQQQGAVPANIGFVKKDELIVDANQRVTRDALLKLRSLSNLEASRRVPSDYLYPPVARMLLMLLFMIVFAVYLRTELPQVYRDNPMLAVFALLTLVVMGSAELQVGRLGPSEFTVPLALAPLVVASLLEKRPALMFTMVLIVVATSVSGLRAPFVPVAAMGGVTAVYSVARLGIAGTSRSRS